MPPREMWHDGKALTAHFKKVRAKRIGEDDGAPEGSFDDAAAGREVTLRNQFADMARTMATAEDDDFMVI